MQESIQTFIFTIKIKQLAMSSMRCCNWLMSFLWSAKAFILLIYPSKSITEACEARFLELLCKMISADYLESFLSDFPFCRKAKSRVNKLATSLDGANPTMIWNICIVKLRHDKIWFSYKPRYDLVWLISICIQEQHKSDINPSHANLRGLRRSFCHCYGGCNIHSKILFTDPNYEATLL